MAKFSQNFWGSDFCTTAGYDVLVRRLKDGKKMCLDFEDYLERRARIEKDYGEALISLGKRNTGKEEIGTLRKSWDTMRAETESSGRIHVTLSHRIIEELHHSIRDFREQQRDVRKKSEDTVKRSAAHKKSCFERNNRLKLVYDNKCRDFDKNEDTYNRLQTIPTTKTRDLTQAQRKMEVSKTASENADVTYRESVRNLEEGRNLWEREMEILCRQFQELEEQRVAFLRHTLWSYCNLLSQSTINIDESCETIRKELESCDVDADIDCFIQEKKTGSERPAPVPYENYYHPSHGADVLGMAATVTNPHHKELPPLPPEPEPERMEGGGGGGGGGGGVDAVYSSIKESAIVMKTEEDDSSYYASPRQQQTPQVIAVYNYEAQGAQELELEEGDIVTVVAREDDVWWCGQHNGKTGMFPVAYVEPYNET